MDANVQIENKLISFEAKLEKISRQINLQEAFIKQQFQREFEIFLCREFEAPEVEATPRVFDACPPNSAVTYRLQNALSTNPQNEQGASVEEEFRPSGFVELLGPESLSGMRLNRNDGNTEVLSDLQASTSRRSEDSNSSSETTSNIALPSSLSSGARNLQQKTRAEEECEENSLASGGSSEDSSSSQDSKSASETLRRKAGLGTRKTSAGRNERMRGSSIFRPQKQNPLKERRFKCYFCPKRFHREEHLSEHMLIHTTEKPNKCSFCQKSFRQANVLRNHHRIHTKEKPFQCSYCAKWFRHASNLRVHKLIHTGDKPHKCSYCPKIFRESGTARRHEKAHRTSH